MYCILRKNIRITFRHTVISIYIQLPSTRLKVLLTMASLQVLGSSLKWEIIFFTIATNLAIWLANLLLSMGVQTTVLASMCNPMPAFSACTLKTTFSLLILQEKTIGSVRSVLSLMICVITVVKICCGLTYKLRRSHKLLITVMMRAIADKSTDHTKPHSIC